jgi:hypothetical protein
VKCVILDPPVGHAIKIIDVGGISLKCDGKKGKKEEGDQEEAAA